MPRFPRPSGPIIAGAAILGLLFLWPQARSIGSRTVVTMTRPFVIAGQWVGDRFGLNPSGRTARAERDALQRQLDEVTARLHEANIALESTKVIDQLTEFTRQSKHELVMANVTTTSADPGIKSIVVDRGSDDGVAVGSPAVTENGLLIGKVVNVRQAISTILLISDRQSVIAGRVQNDAQSPGVVHGERGLTLQMNLIPHGDRVQAGQTVVTSGTEPTIPPDLLIGTISASTGRSGDLFQQATVKPAATLSRLRIIGIVIR